LTRRRAHGHDRAVDVPEIEGPIPATGASGAFGAAAIDGDGLLEEEYFVSGVAPARDAQGRIVEDGVPYTTRIVVRRPADAARFSGTVHVEPFHVLGEAAPTWGVAGDAIARRGDAWIGVTVNSGVFGGYDRITMPGGVALLQDADPDRYARLSLYRADEDAVAALSDVPMTDSTRMMDRITLAIAQGTDIAGQVATLARTGSSAGPLDGVARVYASGWSQTGMFWRAFVQDGRHVECRLPDGGPIVDAYVVSVAPGPDLHPRDTVVVNLLSEGEVAGVGFGARAGVAPDTDDPRFRGYEIPGTFHSWSGRGAQPDDGHAVHNNRPWYLLFHALLDDLDDWVQHGVPMPSEPRITRDRAAADGIARDPDGNALGGVRTPWLDVAAARYAPTCTCHPLTGEMVPFDTSVIAARYGNNATYLEQFDAGVDALVRRRWLRADDAGFVKEQAREEVGVR
jgi:hypothetical protein